MNCRWNTQQIDINVFFLQVLALVRRIVPREKRGPGRPPKHDEASYLTLIVLKELERKSLRGAEVCLSKLLCKERIDHSVIAYWENKVSTTKRLSFIVRILGRLIESRIGSLFSFVDSTRFSNWYIEEVDVTVCNRIANGTVYPVGLSFRRETVAAPVAEAVPQGSGNLYADAWYDDNTTIGVLFDRGYTPIVCPNKNRFKGFYRRKARKLYRMREHRLGYRQRGRGESVFGSLTNGFGDRLHTRKTQTTQSRIAARFIAYQLKLIVRVNNLILRGIIRHAHKLAKLINLAFSQFLWSL